MKNYFLTLTVIISGLFMIGCAGDTASSDEAAGDTAEKTEKVEQKKSKDLSANAEGVFYIDAAQSGISWHGKKSFVDWAHHGTLKLAGGQIEMKGGKVVGGEVVIDMTSIENLDIADNPEKKGKLEGHLKSADFFDVENHPKARFVINSTHGENPQKVAGELTIKGITKPFSAAMDIHTDGKVIKSKGKMEFDRSEFKVAYGSSTLNPSMLEQAKDKIIADQVTLTLGVIAMKK